jgi:DNA ligase D-like protein (predicted 3'-phosphoesterase)
MPPIFVVHEHKASHHHWDLRVEHEGVLASWAVPKEPPVGMGEKRLCIRVDDHELSYAKFEGTIPEGQYGAGTVTIWDKGNVETLSWEEDLKIVVKLSGKKLNGEYVILRFTKAGPKQWLFFKK